MDFIGRDVELGVLEAQYTLDHPLVVVTGRQGIGKSRLILEFIEGRNALYYGADKGTDSDNLHHFSEKVSEITGCGFDHVRWLDAIRAFIELAPSGRKVLVIDEFQCIAASDVNFVKQFKGIWDNYLSQQDVMVILCGSDIGMMREQVLEYRAPLYGRNTCDLRMNPIPFRSVLRGGDYRRAVEEYAVTGGVPRYMVSMDPKESVMANVERLIMGEGAPFTDEPVGLLSDRFGNPSDHIVCLGAMAQGNKSLEEIASAVRMPSDDVLRHLDGLINVGVVEHMVPVTEPDYGHTGGSRYAILDHFVALWSRFICPYMGTTVTGGSDAAVADLHAHFIDSHVSSVFEDICRTELMHHLRLEGVYAAYGSYWEGNIEIDVVAVDPMNHVIYAGGCKFRSTPIGADVLRSLRVKCQKVRPFEGYRVVHCVFSVSGYTDEAVEDSKYDGSVLFDCGEPVVGSL